MPLTDHAIREMGFQEIDPEHPLTAHFHHVSIAEVIGVTLNHGTIIRREVEGGFCLPVTILLGNSVNEMYRSELDDDFVNNEEDWCKEHRVNPPFLMIVVGPTEKHTATEGRWKEDENSGVVTHETFEAAKLTLKDVADQVAQRIYASITVQCSHLTNQLKVKPILAAIAGKLEDGRRIQDISVQMSASLISSKSIEIGEMEQLLSESIERLHNLNKRAAGFLHSAEVEKDCVRRFLSYFVSLEIVTHQSFKSTDKTSTDILCGALPSQIHGEGTAFLEQKYSEFRSLADRFVWCSIVCWSSITDREIAEFRRLKKIRDDIAHGNVGDVTQANVEAVRSLALAVLRA